MNEFSAILPSCGLWSMLSFFLSCLREAIFPYGKREHARPHTIDGMQKYSKTHVPIKVKNVLFVNYALFFANKKTILKALLKIWFCGNHDVHPKTIHQIPWRVSVQFPDGGYGCVPSDPVTETLEDSTFGGNL